MSGFEICYVTYDGLTDPLGGSQVLPYLCGLAARGHRITILSCEKPARYREGAARVEMLCREAGLRWTPLTYHKEPPVISSLYDIALLKRAAIRLHETRRFDLTHCRGYIPALVGLHLKRRAGVPFLFDMRGFWADERVEGNIWPQSKLLYRLIYRRVKRLEARLLRHADHIISLTEEGKRELATWRSVKEGEARITVIPCCVDFAAFEPPDRARRAALRVGLGIAPEARVAAYLGSIGTWYMLDEMLDFCRVYAERHPDARFLFVTQDDSGPIVAAAAARGVGPDRLVIRTASRAEVPDLMGTADLGFFFIKPVFSKKASSPTKMGEMLALGLPIVTNGGVGDVSRIVAETGCGIAIDRFDDDAYRDAIGWVESRSWSAVEMRRRALPWFDAELGIARYDAVYRSIASA